MKLLLWFVTEFHYSPGEENLAEGRDPPSAGSVDEAVLAFVHAEARDEADVSAIETKLVKNLKWAARKNDTRCIVLHSFAHLSDSKATAVFVRELFARVIGRLEAAGYEASQTPFGYFLDLRLEAPGRSLARVFKSF